MICIPVVCRNLDLMPIWVKKEDRIRDPGILRRIKCYSQFSELLLRCIEPSCVGPKSDMRDTERAVYVANRDSLRSLKEPEANAVFTDHPGSLPTMNNLKLKESFVELKRSRKITHVQSNVVNAL
jgi:hypothetical protein